MSVPFLAALGLALVPSFPGDPAEDYEYIARLAEKGMHSQVVREGERFLDEHPREPQVARVRYHIGGARFELGAGESREAKAHTQKAREQYARLAEDARFEFATEAALRTGQCDLRLENAKRAIPFFERVLESDAEYLHLAAGQLLGDALFAEGEFKAARKRYARVVATKGEENAELVLDAAHGLAWCEYRLGNYESCARTVDATLRKFRDDPLADELRFLRAESLFESGAPREALNAYEEVGRGAFREAAVRGAAFACASLDDHEGAVQRFRQLLKEAPDTRYREEALLHLGIHLLEAGRAAEAREALESARANPEVLYWTSRASLELGDSERALGSLERAVRGLDRNDPSAAELRERCLLAQAEILTQLGREDEAARIYESAGSDYALHAAAIAKLNKGEAEEALRLAESVAGREGPYAIPAQLVVGEAHFALGQLQPAQAAFTRVLQSDGEKDDRSRAASRVAWCQYLGGDPQAAAASFRRVKDEFPEAKETEEASFMEGRSWEDAGDLPASAKAYRHYLERYPDGSRREESELRLSELEPSEAGTARLQRLAKSAQDPQVRLDANRRLAETYASLQDYASAADCYAVVLEAGPDARARYGLAYCEYSQGESQAALRTLEPLFDARAGDETHHIAALELGIWAACDVGELERARRLADALVKTDAEDGRRWRSVRVLIDRLRDAGQLDEALTICDRLLRESKDKEVVLEMCTERGHLSLEKGDVEQAARVLETALQHAPDHAGLCELAFFVGEAYLKSGEGARARELLATAAGSSEPSVRARSLYLLGFTELQAGEPAKALAPLRKLVQEHRDSELFVESLYLLGEALYREGQDEDAIAVLTTSRREVPKHATASKVLFRLGLAQARSEEFRGANETLTELATRFPDFEGLAEAELARGRSLSALRKSRSAKQAYERVLELDKGVLSARARLGLGALCEADGKTDDALSHYLKVSVLYSQEEEVGEALFRAGNLLEANGDREQARQQYRELVKEYPKHPRRASAEQRLKQLEQESSE